MLFIGGQRALDADGRVLGAGDIEVQTEESFRNLDTMLRAGGGDRNDLMRQNTYFRFFGEGREVTAYWEKMTRVRRRYMSVPSAAGAGLRIRGMGHVDELIQVEGIGVVGSERQRLQPAGHWDWSIPNTQFTQGWAKGELIFIGGQISADDKAQAVGADMETQARNVSPLHPQHARRGRLQRGGRGQALYLFSCRGRLGRDRANARGDRAGAAGVLSGGGAGGDGDPRRGLRLREPPDRDRGVRRAARLMAGADFTAAEFADRQARLRAALTAAGLDGLVVIHPAAIHWLTGSEAKSYQEFQCLLVSAVDGPVAALVRVGEVAELEAESIVPEVVGWGGGVAVDRSRRWPCWPGGMASWAGGSGSKCRPITCIPITMRRCSSCSARTGWWTRRASSAISGW